ncbi:MAG TPA: M50 family metallopeptidase [Acidimicrobiales bacterium]|nr:M50 family metallopeptidase [Acidimicrobiales bacterium]
MAGSTVHFIIALIIIFVMLVGTGYPSITGANEISSVTSLPSGAIAPAAAAHLTPQDRIVGVGDHRSNIDSVIKTIETHPGTPLSLLVERNGRVRSVTVRPITRAQGGVAPAGTKAGKEGFIGVSLGGLLNVKSGVLVAVPRTFSTFGSVVSASFAGIGQVFSASGLRSFAHQVATASNHSSTSASSNSGSVISIVGAVQLGSKAASRDVAALLYLLVAINVFVGIINLFPMLPLDGGHVVIALYERVRSRRGRQYHADVSKLMPIAYAFLALIIVFGLGALYSNILNPVA